MPKLTSATDRSDRLQNYRTRPFTRSRSANDAALALRAPQNNLSRAESDAVDILVRISSREHLANDRPASRSNRQLHTMPRRADTAAADALMTLAGVTNPAPAAPTPSPAAPQGAARRAASNAASTLLGIARSSSGLSLAPTASPRARANAVPPPIDETAIEALLSLGVAKNPDSVATEAPQAAVATEAPQAAVTAAPPAAADVVPTAPRPVALATQTVPTTDGRILIQVPTFGARRSDVPAGMYRAHNQMLAAQLQTHPAPQTAAGTPMPQTAVRAPVPQAVAASTAAAAFGAGAWHNASQANQVGAFNSQPIAGPPSALARQAFRPAVLARLYGTPWMPTPSFTPMISIA